MPFDNQGITIYDESFWQTILFDSNGNWLPPERRNYIDFVKMRDAGNASATVLKVGQHNYLDPAFPVSWRDSKGILPRSAYWFMDYRSTAKAQAIMYWDAVKNDLAEGMYFFDFESGSGNWNQLYNAIYEFQQLSGLPNDKIGIYTGYYYWTENVVAHPTNPASLATLNWFAKYPLWLAYYSEIQYIRVPKGWTMDTLLLWQWGTPSIGRSVGCWSEEVDANLLNGGYDKLYKYFGRIGNIPVPPNPVSFPYSITIGDKEYKQGV